jgi:hypothetical protein
MTTYGPFEHIFVETDWYDGPRAGIANVNGRPHRFLSEFDESSGYLDTFLVWPIDAEELALEQEQWQIYVEWNQQYQTGTVDASSHPGHSGTNKRWDELATLLEPRRQSIPANAKRAKAQLRFPDRRDCNANSSPRYQLSWALL